MHSCTMGPVGRGFEARNYCISYSALAVVSGTQERSWVCELGGRDAFWMWNQTHQVSRPGLLTSQECVCVCVCACSVVSDSL